nr:hypothetical protein [Rhodoglobus vestalii]
MSLVTEALQKEIVKRLLYSAKPAKLSRSQLNRIRGLNISRAIGLAVLGGLVIGSLAWLYELPAPFSQWVENWSGTAFPWVPMNIQEPAGRILDGALVAGALLLAQWGFSHARIREVAVGEFKLTGSDPVQNYFDQYLDEIVYFFSRTKTSLVIFEDLDRFGDKGIFIALRELNVLLNNSAAVDKPVTFIYAIRDSIFTPKVRVLGPEGVAAASTDRAKFFDLIVPVVPFVSTEVSGGLLSDELNSLVKDEQPAGELVSLAGRYFPDMRVILSIRNEYDLYLDRLVRNGAVDLDHNHLFAVLLFKHAYPEQFELIQFGTSALDALVNSMDTCVTQRLRGLDFEITNQENELASEAGLETRSKEAGARLLALIGLFAGNGRGDLTQLDLGGVVSEPSRASTPDFWRELDADPTGDLGIAWSSGRTFSIRRSDLNVALAQYLPAESWITQASHANRTQLERLRSARWDLQHASFIERLTDGRYQGAGIDDKKHTIEVDFLASARNILGEGFALELALSGYLDGNFALYTSVYQGSLVSSAAQSYRIQFVSRRRSSPLTTLSAADIREIRTKVGDRFLEEPSVLNISIFDDLLERGALDKTIDLLARQEIEGSREFVLTYLAGGKHKLALLRKIAPNANWILTLIADDLRASNQRKLEFLGEALCAMAFELNYELSPDVERLIRELAHDSLKRIGPVLGGGAARGVARLLSHVHAQVPDLTALSADARNAIGGIGAYVMSRRNLASLAQAKGNIGLDSIGRQSPHALRQVLKRLSEYLKVLDSTGEETLSIDRGEDPLDLIISISDFGPRAVEEVLRRANKAAVIQHLPEASDDIGEELRSAFPSLAQTSSFVPTASNVLTYFDVVGQVDEALSGYLIAHPVLDGVVNADDEHGVRLIQALLSSSLALPTLASVIISVSLDGKLDARKFRVERPELIKALLDQAVFTDDIVTFTAMGRWPWEVREAAYAHTKVWADLVSQLQFSSGDIEQLLSSRKIAAERKIALLREPALVANITTPVGANAALKVSIERCLLLSATQLDALVAAGASDRAIIEYLGTNGDQIDDDEVVALIGRLSQEWSVLARHSSSWRIYKRSKALDSLLKRLIDLGLVSKVSWAKGDRVRVTMRSS